MRDVRYDQFSYQEVDPIIVDTTAQKLTLANGAVLTAHASVPSDAKGFKASVIWFEEFDQLLRLQPKTIAAAVGVLLSEPNARLVITANKDTGAYKLFEDLLTKPEYAEDVKFFSIDDTQAPHIEAAGNTGIVKAFMTATVGADYAEQQIHNQDSYEGEVFHVQDVMDANNTYDYWMGNVKPRPDRVVIGIDPGQGHATGIMILGQHNDHLYEIESHEFVGKRLDKAGALIAPKTHQKQVSEDYIKTFITEKAHALHADIVCETNSGGAWWMQHWREQPGIKIVKPSDFGKPGTRNDRNGFIHELSQLLGDGKFHFKNDQLRSQLISYNPDDRESVEWSNKGDLADATLHAAHYIIKKEKVGNRKHTTWDGR
jgi:hypothetical protein